MMVVRRYVPSGSLRDLIYGVRPTLCKDVENHTFTSHTRSHASSHTFITQSHPTHPHTFTQSHPTHPHTFTHHIPPTLTFSTGKTQQSYTPEVCISTSQASVSVYSRHQEIWQTSSGGTSLPVRKRVCPRYEI